MKKILLSIHDATPSFAPEIALICKTLDGIGAARRSILVVPDFLGETPITAYPEWCRAITAHKEAGSDIGLHGIRHHYAECGFWSLDRARMELERSRGLFLEAFGCAPTGFVAPQWFQSAGCKQAVRELGFLYSGRWTGLFDARNACIARAFPTNFDWGNPLADKFFAFFNARRLRRKKEGVVRFSIHPMDVRHGFFELEMQLLRELLADGWLCRSYGDAAQENAAR